MIDVILTLPLDNLNTKGFEDNDSYASLWSVLVYLRIDGNWSKIFNLSPSDLFKGKLANKDGHSLRYHLETRSFTLTLRLPKRVSPKDCVLTMSAYTMNGTDLSWGYNGLGNYSLFLENNTLKLKCSSYSTPTERCHFYFYETLSDTDSWKDIKQTFVLKKLDSYISVYSESDKDLSNIYYVHPTFYHSSDITFYPTNTNITSGTYSPVSPIYVVRPHLNNYYSFDTSEINYRIDFITQNDYRWENPFYNNTFGNLDDTIESEGKTYTHLASIITQFSETGKLPFIHLPNNKDGLTAEDLQLEGETLKYLLLVNAYNEKDSILFRYALIPLPEKMYSNKRYIFKNKPGTSFFSEPINRTELNTRGYRAIPKVVNSEDVIIEEYDIM